MADETLTVDEAMEDILAALSEVMPQPVPEGYKTIDEIMAASGVTMQRKTFLQYLERCVELGSMEKFKTGRYVYYRAKK